MRTYGTQDNLKRHMRYAHNVNKIRCRWCPYEVSSNVRFRSQHWYRYHVEQAELMKENNSRNYNGKTEKGEKKEHTTAVQSTVNNIYGKKEEEIK